MTDIPDRYRHLPLCPPDKVYVTAEWFAKDPNPDKMFLSIGAYRDEKAQPYVLPVVKKAEERYMKAMNDGKENKEYCTIDGYKPFRDACVQLLYGDACPPLDHIASFTSLSGTGALRIAAEFLNAAMDPHTPVYFSKQTWPNHGPIFLKSGLHHHKTYRYYDNVTNGLDVKGLMDDLWAAVDGAIVVFHMCGHNPTGVDPSEEEWTKLCSLAKMKKFRVVFDCPYQGYASGCLDRDAASIRMFAKAGVDVIACQSFAKNMGMYGDRVGCCSLICGSADSAKKVQAYMKANVIRPMYSSPPRQPQRIVHMILTDPQLRKEWEDDLTHMATRIRRMRQLVYDELIRLKTPGRWNHIIDQIGMFSYLGLTPEMCRTLVSEHHVYVLESARASMAGLTDESAPKLARCIDKVVRQHTGKAKAKL